MRNILFYLAGFCLSAFVIWLRGDFDQPYRVSDENKRIDSQRIAIPPDQSSILRIDGFDSSLSRQARSPRNREADPNPGVLIGSMAADLMKEEWLDAVYELQGVALLNRQRSICRQAAIELIPSGNFDGFASFLEGQGATDFLTFLTTDGAREVFAGSKAELAREWFATYEYERYAVPMAFQVGRTYDGPDFKAYMARIKSPAIRASLLAGYCSSLAVHSPEKVVSTYVELRPEGTDLSGLATVMGSLPSGVNHSRIAASLPPDAKTLARQARRALLENWASTRPAEAAHYVLMNPDSVAPRQIEAVLGSWRSRDEAAADRWVEALAAGALKDESLKARSAVLTEVDPVAAWESVKRIGDLDTRIAAARGVFEVWNHRDPERARREWLSLFPAATGETQPAGAPPPRP